MNRVREKAKELDVIGEYDVIVVGGGPGGVPAALAAARAGSKTLIVERYGFFGGLATAGLMGPLFGYAEMKDPYVQYTKNPDASGNVGPLILGGIPLEIVRKLQEWGAAPRNEDIQWEAIRFDPEMLKHLLDAMVTEAGVEDVSEDERGNGYDLVNQAIDLSPSITTTSLTEASFPGQSTTCSYRGGAYPPITLP